MSGIGDALRDARLSRGLTHEYISQIIKIRPEFLKALEDEDYAALPGNFYAKNFLRRYADFLGLDSASIIERFVAQENAAAQQADTFALQPMKRAPRRGPRLGVLGALLVLGAAVALLGYGTLRSLGRDGGEGAAAGIRTPSAVVAAGLPTSVPTPNPQPPTPRPADAAPTTRVVAAAPTRGEAPAAARTQSPAGATATPTATPPAATPTRSAPATTVPAPGLPTSTPTGAPVATTVPAPIATVSPGFTGTPTGAAETPGPAATGTVEPEVEGEIVARVRAVETSDLTVRADGDTVFEGVVPAGDTRYFGANANLYVRSTDPESVFVSVNRCRERTIEAYGCPARNCRTAWFNFPATYRRCG